MNAIPFDTLKMARKLEAAGFPGPQAAGAAEAMAEAMSGAELATKADLFAVKVELQHELAREIGLVRTDMTAMETRLTAAIARVSSDVEILRRDMTIRLGAITVGSTGVLVAAMRFMLSHP